MKKTYAPLPSAGLSPSLRRFLYTTAAITGAAILIVEILGAKMLAPYVGTSHFVWTAQIAVTLVALAAGYYAGGRLADRAPHLRKLYAAILVAALYLGVSVMLVEPVAYGCLRFKLAIGSLLASAFLFFIPLSLLAMVGPFLVRVLTESVSGVGGNVGRLTALSTLGSVAGTVLIGYVLIPFLPNSLTMYLTAALLTGVSVAYFFVCDRRHVYRPTVAGTVVLLALLGLGTYRLEQLGRQHSTELFRANSNFGLLQVLDNQAGTRRLFLNDYLLQNTYDPVAKQSTSMFTYLLHDLARAYTPKLERVLCIGLGVGIAPMQFAAAGAVVDVVEINPQVPPIARDFFHCRLDRLNVVIGDGRYFINAAPGRTYDAINLDAFLGDSSPVHLFTREAFAAMRRILKPEGVLVMNVFGDFAPGRDFFMASLERTLREGAGFRSVKIHAAGSGGNVFFVASDQADLKVLRTPDFEQVHPACRVQVRAAFETVREVDPAHGRILTDDHNPLEYYDAANRERVRRDYALSVRALRAQRY